MVRALPGDTEKLKGFIHWVSKDYSEDAIVNVFNYLFADPEVGDDWLEKLNPESLIVKPHAKVWSNLKDAKEYDHF